MIRQVRPRTGIIGLLGLPGHQSIFDVYLPAAAAGAIHAVSGTDDFFSLPARSVVVLPGSVLIRNYAVTIGEGPFVLPEKEKPIDELAQDLASSTGPLSVCSISEAQKVRLGAYHLGRREQIIASIADHTSPERWPMLR
jgi:hypothetical protein